MYDTLNAPVSKTIKSLSGEELLLLAVFGSTSMKPKIDRELDRRTRAGTAGHRGVVPTHSAPFTGFAA